MNYITLIFYINFTLFDCLIHRALDLDDFKNVCGCEEYPLLRTINRVLRKYPESSKTCILEDDQVKRDPPITPTKRPIQKDPENITPPIKNNRTSSTTTKRTTTTSSYQSELDDDLNDERGCNEGQFYRHETKCEK